MFLNRPGAQERTSTNMAPKFAVPFQHEQCFAQLATRNAENIRQLTFRRKPTLPRLGTLRQISLQLSQRGLLFIHNRTPRNFAIPVRLQSNAQPIPKDCVTNQELVSIGHGVSNPTQDETTGRRWYEPDLQIIQ